MSDELDINEIASGVISTQIDRLIESVKETTKTFTGKMSLSLRKTLDAFIKLSFERHRCARSFFSRGEPVYIYSFYVPLGVTSASKEFSKTQAQPLFSHCARIVIEGSGGCGKSVLSRHLLLDTLCSALKIPILIELRALNKRKLSLTDLIQECLRETGLILSDGALLRAMEKGQFALLFDGFDELEGELRANISREIRRLASGNRDLWMLVTSRPDSEFGSWTDFKRFQAMPLTLHQAVDLVDRTPIDAELKSRFIEDLQKSLFEKHKSFLSNPLLLSIMLLTYHDSADIPSKLSVFYSQAFEALFHRHDAWKGGFKRERKSQLDIHDFSRAFSAFSLIAYDKRLFSFRRETALEIVKQSASLTHLNFNAENFVQDAIQAICLLVEDGLQISYAHRSFQEYFAARFIADAPPKIKEQLLERIGRSIQTDTVVALLHEMQPEFVETFFLAPHLDKLFKSFNFARGSVSRALHLRYLQYFFETISISSSGEITGSRPAAWKRRWDIVRFSLIHCSYLISAEFFLEAEHDWEAFTKKNYPEGVTLETKEITTKEPLIQEMYAFGKIFGERAPRFLWEIRGAIRRKGTQTEQSVVDILSK